MLKKILPFAVLAAVVVAIGITIGWLGSRGPEPVLQPPPESPSVSTPLVFDPLPAAQTNVSARTRPARPTQATNPPPGPEAAAPAATNVSTNWEDKLDAILASEGEDAQKVQELFAIFPALSEEGKVEVAQHLSNLVSDDQYKPLGDLAQDASLSEDVLDVLIADLLNRPNAAKLPALLEIARNASHPKAGEAKDFLELYIEEDYGTDWARWQQGMEAWLKENPD